MAKLTLADLSSISSNESGAVATINSNSALIETALENTLSRDGTSPNTMSASLDMNSNRVLNLPEPVSNNEPIRRIDFLSQSGILQGADGWTPVLAVVSDGTRRVHQIVDYIGGEGTEPTTYLNFYLSTTGPVSSIASGTDIRGPQGATGAGSGDLLAANNLSDLASISTARGNLGLGALALLGTVSYSNMNSTAIATESEAEAGTASKLVPAAVFPNAVLGVAAFSSKLLHIQDQKASGTNGGTFTAGAWRTRTLNTSLTNEITGSSLSSNQITLPSGTYYLLASAIGGGILNEHKVKWRNVTDASDTLIGMTSGNGGASSSINVQAMVCGRFSITSSKVFELQHRCGATQSSVGFGAASSFGVVEVYSDVQIWKVA